MVIIAVSGFALEWIEIGKFQGEYYSVPVSGFALEWIEIQEDLLMLKRKMVSGFALEWIEIRHNYLPPNYFSSLRLRAGVD